MIDLHTHSTASDGSLSPAQLVRSAASAGLTALALTDHDTIAGLEEAEAEAKKAGLRFIPGVELEIAWVSESGAAPPGEFHLLGLGIRRPTPAFVAALRALAEDREERNREILARLEDMGLRADYGELRALAGDGSIGRPHIAALLVRQGLAPNRELAFSRYLGKGRPFYVPRRGIPFGEALVIIKESGGIPVLAHPLSLFVAWGRLPGLVAELRAQGLEGLEAWHPTAKVRACHRLEQLGRSLGLYITAGSDFHGEARPDRRLGYSSPGRKISEDLLAAIPPLYDAP
ncbi:MAG: PHP domain-containing protein [Spirochaetaceae bacterium]|nr:PHP domain-containing protein [Spirochaetaceae bacterium]